MKPNGSFAIRLISWWEDHGRNELPWQHPRTAYRVWISEIMLQQTQVTTVIPYFLKWMDRFPDIVALADAPLDEALSHWAGLGYYARARNAHKAARICLETFSASLPTSAEELISLPGIGLSTANAIISQSSDRPAAVLDGNVRRVLARHARISGWTGSSPVQRELWREAEQRLPQDQGANYTQAIMDLGAMVCTHTAPDCKHCPVHSDCQAYEAGEVHLYPAPRPKKARLREQSVSMLILQDDEGAVLMEKRPPSGIWGGLWSLPQAEDLAGLEQQSGLDLSQCQLLPAREHRLTHLRMNIQPVMVRKAQPEQVKCSAEQCWVKLDTPGKLGMPKPVSDIMRELTNKEYA